MDSARRCQRCEEMRRGARRCEEIGKRRVKKRKHHKIFNEVPAPVPLQISLSAPTISLAGRPPTDESTPDHSPSHTNPPLADLIRALSICQPRSKHVARRATNARTRVVASCCGASHLHGGRALRCCLCAVGGLVSEVGSVIGVGRAGYERELVSGRIGVSVIVTGIRDVVRL